MIDGPAPSCSLNFKFKEQEVMSLPLSKIEIGTTGSRSGKSDTFKNKTIINH
jgi:hypothetical protein